MSRSLPPLPGVAGCLDLASLDRFVVHGAGNLTDRMGSGGQQQGATLEKLFHELLARLLRDDLGYELLQNSLQSSGVQYGKDIQTRWQDKDGQECFWHFECKSHREGVLHQKEVADKIIDVYRSAHRIDVWCLALAHIEPGVWIDEVFA